MPQHRVSGLGLALTRYGSQVRAALGVSQGAYSLALSQRYTAIFLVLSAITTRGLLIGLAYALIWEGIVAGLLPGSQAFSVREYLTGIVQTLAPQAGRESLVGSTGFVYAVVAFVLALAIGSVRLSRYEVRGAE